MNRRYRKTIIAGNWKMNMTASEVKGFALALSEACPRARWCETVICVPFPLIPAAVKAFRDCHVAVGAQNMSEHESGAFTGEVSSAQLTDLGVKYVIIGHSERRQYYGETDFSVNAKAVKALDAGLIPIICVGESLEQREKGLTMEHIAYQVKAALSGLSDERARKCVIAYEPIWAIGTGKTAGPDDAAEVCEGIRAVVRGMFGARAARAVTIQYGGSMNASNAAQLLAKTDIDGGLIGGASLKPADFAKIILAANQEPVRA